MINKRKKYLNEKPTQIFNPLNKPFKFQYDVNENSQPEQFEIGAGEVATFPFYLARHAREQLAEAIINKNGDRPNHEDAHNQAIKEVSLDD